MRNLVQTWFKVNFDQLLCTHLRLLGFVQALSLERLNTLLRNLAPWVGAADSLRDESPVVVTHQQLREESHAWAIMRSSVRAVLASLTSTPAQFGCITVLPHWSCCGRNLG
jgi:hypothetical protein